MKKAHPEYMIRVKLPSSSAYHSSPSGDTEFEDAYDKAIKDALPTGFKVIKPKFNEKYAKDSEGRSIVLIEPVSPDHEALAYYIGEVRRLEQIINEMKGVVGRL